MSASGTKLRLTASVTSRDARTVTVRLKSSASAASNDAGVVTVRLKSPTVTVEVR